MGERGNVKFAVSGVYLYTHWRGHEIEQIVRDALSKKERWDDEPYLTRIVFDEMTGRKESMTGFGISTEECDPNYPTIILDCDKQEVSIEGRDGSMSFEDCVNGKGIF